MSTRQERAQIIVQKILENLRDRQGFKHLLESIELEDEDTYNELVATLVDITENEIDLWD